MVSPSPDDDADLDYLFLQFGVERATVTDRQNCGNLLAGVGPFAVERGLIAAGGDVTTTRIRMLNSGSAVTATFATPGGWPDYRGDTAIAGVPGTAAPVTLRFADTAGSATGRLLPTGNVRDVVRRRRGDVRGQRHAGGGGAGGRPGASPGMSQRTNWPGTARCGTGCSRCGWPRAR